MGKKVTHVEGRSKEERKRIRAKLGKLKDLTVQPRTKLRYDKALERFYTYLRIHDLLLPTKRVLLDQLLSDYLEHLWMEGEGRCLASDTVAALQNRDPLLKGQLLCSWRLLKTWVSHELPCRAPPLTEEALHTLVGYAIFHRQHQFALTLLLGFYGLLRTGELLSIRNRDAPHRWRKMFNDTISALSLDSYQYRPYSLRRGGATFYFSKHGQLDRLLIQGRWQSTKTARLYLNSGMAILAENELKLTPHARTFFHQFKRSKSHSLPKLEHALTGRAGDPGRKTSMKQHQKKRREKICFEMSFGDWMFPGVAGPSTKQHSLASIHLGLARELEGECSEVPILREKSLS